MGSHRASAADAVLGVLASPGGRWLRLLSGIALVGAGLTVRPRRWPLVAAGLLPLVGAAADVVPVAGLFGRPVRGGDLRRSLGTVGEAPLLLDWSDVAATARARMGAP